MITLTIKDEKFKKDLDRFAKKSNKQFKSAIRDATDKMHELAQKKVRQLAKGKVRSGFLMTHIKREISSNGFTGTVTSHAEYSQAFEEGTRPHGIRIKNKRILAGPKRGAPIGWKISKKSAQMGYATYGKKVQHPGTQPRPFMYPAWKSACLHLEKLIRKMFN